MPRLISSVRKYYVVVVFAAFAVLFARALHYAIPGGADLIFAVKAKDGFFAAVAYGARRLGDGIVASFLRTALTVLPPVIWKIVCTAAVVYSDFALARVACRALSTDGDGTKERDSRFAAAFAFSSAFFALIPASVLRDSVFSVSGTVRFVLPTALVLAFYLTLERSSRLEKGAWYAPLFALCASLLSWQAALCAALIALWFFIRALRAHRASVSGVLALAAPVLCFAAHYALWNVPRFPDVSRMFALRSFLASVFDQSGFFPVMTALSLLVFARVLREKIVPVLRSKDRPHVSFVLYFALALATALNSLILLIRSPLVPDVTVSGAMTVTVSAVTALLIAAAYVIELRETKNEAPVLFSLCALVAASATLPTVTYSGAYFYLPTVLLIAVCTAEFLRVRRHGGASALICALGACYAATLCLTGGKALIAIAVAVFAAACGLSPLFRRLHMTQIIALLLAALTVYAMGEALAASSAIDAANEAKIEEYKKDSAQILILDETFVGGVTQPSPDEGQLTYYKKLHGLGDSAPVYFVDPENPEVPQNVGDLNGDGKVNAVDRVIFMKYLGK